MSIVKLFKNWILSLPLARNYYLKKRVAEELLIPEESLSAVLERADTVLVDVLLPNIKVGLVKDGLEPEGYVFRRYYYPMYQRFLENNNISYEFYDINASDWIEQASKFDVVIWHTKSDPNTQDIAGNKLYILDKVLGKKCHPNFDQIWTYENKINAHYLYKVNGFPEIPTYVSHSLEDALSYIEKIDFPIVSKLSTGSSSYGVEKLDTIKEAKSLIKKAFSYQGKRTYFPFQRQKDYVYFQQFIYDASYDLRVIVIGNKVLGYYRYPNKGDFRASGAGNYEKKELPVEAMELAYQVRKSFKADFLATDFLYSKSIDKYFIIESSIFIGVDTPEQLVVNGTSGYYERLAENEYIFKKGRFWPQELALKEFFEKI